MQAVITTPNGIAYDCKMMPRILDDSAVTLKVTLAGLCRTDVYVAQGKIPVPEGLVLGHEFTGIIEEFGSQVKGLSVGQRVAVMPISGDTMLGVERDGAYAEYICVPASQVYPIPDAICDEAAVFLEPIAASLAVCGVGLTLKQRGLIYGVNRIAELTHRIMTLKGFESIDREASAQDTRYDFIIETQPTTKAFEEMLRLLKPKGTLVLKSRPFDSIPLSIATIVKNEINVVGAYYGNFKEGIELLACGRLQLTGLFGETYSLEEAVPMLLGEKNIPEGNKVFFKP